MCFALKTHSTTHVFCSYNSVAFVTTQANQYTVMAASEEFLNGSEYDISNLSSLDDSNGTLKDIVETAKDFRDRIKVPGLFRQLNARDCLTVYGTQYVSTRGDVLLVQNHTSVEFYKNSTSYSCDSSEIRHAAFSYILSPTSMTPYTWMEPVRSYEDYACTNGLPYQSRPMVYPSYDWQCPQGSPKPCHPENKTVIPDPDDWRPYGDKVQYCWSENVVDNCKLSFNLDFAVVVMICNLCKVIGMFLTYKTHKQWALITLGDAIESFLDRPDDSTLGLCIYSTDRIQLIWGWGGGSSYNSVPLFTNAKEKSLLDHDSKQWSPRSQYWAAAANRRRWACCFIL